MYKSVQVREGLSIEAGSGRFPLVQFAHDRWLHPPHIGWILGLASERKACCSSVILLGCAGKQNSWNLFSWSCRFPDPTVPGWTDAQGNPDPAKIGGWTPNIISITRFSLLYLGVPIFMIVWKLFEDKYHPWGRQGLCLIQPKSILLYWFSFGVTTLERMFGTCLQEFDGRWDKDIL